MKKRGGYAGNLSRQIKVRVSEDMYHNINRMSEDRHLTVAGVIRQLLSSHVKLHDTTGADSKVTAP